MRITKANVADLPPHEIRYAAEKGNKVAQAEIAKRRKNRRGGIEPYWETD